MTEFSTPVQGGSSVTYNADLTSGGADVLAAQVSTITVTIVDESENIINSRDAQDVKNINGGTLTDGHFALVLNEGDTAHDPNDPSNTQVRYLHFDIVLVGGATHVHEVLWYVQGNHVPGND